MRIIAGKHRGRKLLTPKDDTVIRPTTDFTREALFNILSTRIVEADVLDLFGGTGALSLESLSRGARSATVADRSRESIALIRKNAAMMGETPEIIEGEYDTVCRRLNGRAFDVIFLDPPYKMEVPPILGCLAANALLRVGGVVVYEHDKGYVCPETEGWSQVDERHYGRVAITFLTEK